MSKWKYVGLFTCGLIIGGGSCGIGGSYLSYDRGR